MHWLAWVPFLLVLFAELGLRFAVAEKLRLRSYPAIYRPKPVIGYEYIPNSTGRLCAPQLCKTIKINASGYVGKVYPVKAAENQLRIAVVDMCNGTGHWMATGQPYPTHLQQMLRKSGYCVEVLNFSVDGGARDLENVRLAERRAKEYRPDLLLLSTNLPFQSMTAKRAVYRDYMLWYPGNIPGAFENAKRQVDYLESKQMLASLYHASYLVRGVARYYMNNFATRDAAYVRAFVTRTWTGSLRPRPFSLLQSVAALRDVQDTQAKHGGKLVLMGPTDRGAYRAFEQQGFDALDVHIDSEFIRRHTTEHNGHWTDEVQRTMATQVMEGLVRSGYLNEHANCRQQLR